MCIEIDDDIKSIYNNWLATSRGRRNKPFRLRKDFKGFEKDKKYLFLLKIKNLIDNNKEVTINEFLIAPYEVYKYDLDTAYDLKFYTTRKAIKVYNIYKQIENNKEGEK